MLRKFAVLAAFITFILPAVAQKNFTIQEATLGQGSTFAPKSMRFVEFIGKSTFLSEVKSFKELWKIAPNGEENTVILSLADLNKILAGKEEMAYFPYLYQWKDDTSFAFIGTKNAYVIQPFSKKLLAALSLKEYDENAEFAPHFEAIAFTEGQNLFISFPSTGIEQITHDTEDGIENGKSVHRQEFGIHKGTFWSPNANYLAFYRKDEKSVDQYPLVNTAERIAKVENIRYPMAGLKSEEVTLGIYDVKNKKTIFVETGEPKDQFLTTISWDYTEKFIYIGILNRAQNHLKLNQYDVKTGKYIKTILEEKNSKYVEPENELLFLKKTNNQFIYQSEKDGYNHLYLYNTSGKLIKQLTKGNWMVLSVLGFDEAEEHIYYTSTQVSAKEVHAYKVHIKSGKTTALTKENGVHQVKVSSDGTVVFDQYSNINTPNIAQIISPKNGKTTRLLEAENPYKEYAMPKAELVDIQSADNVTNLHARIIKPTRFDANKKYPVIIYVYGGPHAQMVTNSWLGGARLWEYYMAQKGYIVFTVDNRGSANRGFEFESVIHRQLGQAEMADQMKGVEYLKSLPYVDENRIGVHGWSFGGFMTMSLLTTFPDVFKVGVAGGPVCDWKFYEVMYGERYMDTPDENPEGYKLTSLLDKANKLKAKLLIIHGAQDDVVVMQHSMEFINACIKANIPVDYFLYPDHKHNVMGKDRVHLMQKITQYFDDYLK